MSIFIHFLGITPLPSVSHSLNIYQFVHIHSFLGNYTPSICIPLIKYLPICPYSFISWELHPFPSVSHTLNIYHFCLYYYSFLLHKFIQYRQVNSFPYSSQSHSLLYPPHVVHFNLVFLHKFIGKLIVSPIAPNPCQLAELL